MDNQMDEETLLAKAAEIQKARDEIKKQARDEEWRKEKEADYNKLVGMVKPFLGSIKVIEGAVHEYEERCNSYTKYVHEFNAYLETLPMLRFAHFWDRGCLLRITVEVIGPTDEEGEDEED